MRVVWAAIAVFIAGITSALTTQRLQGVVRTTNDLRSVRVGALAGSSTVDFLAEQRIAFRSYPSAAEGLRAAQSGEIDAFVYDRPLLAWMLQQDFPHLELTQITLDIQNYAIALQLNNTVREELDVELLLELADRSEILVEPRTVGHTDFGQQRIALVLDHRQRTLAHHDARIGLDLDEFRNAIRVEEEAAHSSMSRPVSLSLSKSNSRPTSGDSRKNCTRLLGWRDRSTSR